MGQGYQSLTKKEKETLRLLSRGHDAKSIARHYSLSVHTINERLRDARRKLGISSSRGAARLLQDIEQQSPDFHGDEDFGAAHTPADAASVKPSADGPRISRRIGMMIAGALTMITLALVGLLAMQQPYAPALNQSAPPPSAPASPAAASPVETAARQWLAMVDAGDWPASWQATGEQFRSLNPVERWATASETVRTPLGRMVSRELVTEDFTPAPPNGYATVRFTTSYAERAGATETLSLAWEGGAWRVVGYIID